MIWIKYFSSGTVQQRLRRVAQFRVNKWHLLLDGGDCYTACGKFFEPGDDCGDELKREHRNEPPRHACKTCVRIGGIDG